MINKSQLTELARKALKNDTVTFDASTDNTAEWDSLGQLSLLIALDKATDGKAAKLSELPGCTSLAQIFAVLVNHNLAREA
jgi:acyl carrier protein